MRVADRVAEVRCRNWLGRAQRRGQDNEEVRAVDDGETTEDREKDREKRCAALRPLRAERVQRGDKRQRVAGGEGEQQQLAEAEEILPMGQHDECFAS